MSQPEISRRCLACGASVHPQAMFCPDCGQPLSQPAGNFDKTLAGDGVEVRGGSAEATTQKLETSAAGTRTPTGKRAGQPAPGNRPRTAKARETLHRASAVAKEALEDNVKRVETIRQVSSVVLEEAHYDPSLRFVLVAILVFIVFVILLVLSKVMG